MVHASRPTPDEVDQLLLNAQLRDELEPYLDDSICFIDARGMPTAAENDFLKAMLDWECAPVLPISQWFEPELQISPPDALADEQLHLILWDTIHKIYEKRIILDFTDHLSDRALYQLIYRDILPSREKCLAAQKGCLHWDCADIAGDPDTWLRFYATEEERGMWAEETGQDLPPVESPPFRRKMPSRPHE